MNPEIKAEWLSQLRSGAWRRTNLDVAIREGRCPPRCRTMTGARSAFGVLIEMYLASGVDSLAKWIDPDDSHHNDCDYANLLSSLSVSQRPHWGLRTSTPRMDYEFGNWYSIAECQCTGWPDAVSEWAGMGPKEVSAVIDWMAETNSHKRIAQRIEDTLNETTYTERVSA